MYEFSVPMPYNKEHIDKLININNEVEKSKITSLYFSLPSTCELYTGFEQRRNTLLEKSDFSFWKDLMEYSVDKGFDVTYCLNSPRFLAIENPNFSNQLDKLHMLLDELYSVGIKNLRVANPKLISYINEYYPQFKILGSTVSDFKIIQEFQFFHEVHPYVKEIVPSFNVNKNFTLLKNVVKLGLNVEIMVNEGCIYGCSNRLEHAATFQDGNFKQYFNDKVINNNFCSKNCSKVLQSNEILYIIMGGIVFPWEIKEYGKIGINKFKLVGRDASKIKSLTEIYLNNTLLYLKGIDNIKYIEYYTLKIFSHHLKNNAILNKMTVKEYKKYLPKIDYYKKYGHLCSSRCGVECKYCYKCAEKIQKIFINNSIKRNKQNTPVCFLEKNKIE